MSRAFPHNLEAEKALLGSILLDNAVLYRAVESIKPEDFFSSGNLEIYSAMLELSERGSAIDLVTLSEKLSRAGRLEKVGGAGYIASLTDGIPIGVSASVEEYRRIIADKSRARKLVQIGDALASGVLAADGDADALSSQAITDLLSLGGDGAANVSMSFYDAGKSLMHKLSQPPGPVVMSGITKVDLMTGGFRRGELIIIAARSGIGKTLFAQQIRKNSCRHGIHGVYCTGEMSHESLVAREMATLAGVWHSKLRRGSGMSDDDMERLRNALGHQCRECKITYGALSTGQIAASAQRMKAIGKLGLAIIDYDQLVSAKGQNRMERLSAVTEFAWHLAVSLQIPVLLLSQLRKSQNEREGGESLLDDLYGPGDKGNFASTAIYIRRKIDSEYVSGIQPAKLILPKCRNGETGTVECGFSRERLEFVNWDSTLDGVSDEWESEAVSVP